MLGNVIRKQAEKNGFTSVRDYLSGNEIGRGWDSNKSNGIGLTQRSSSQPRPLDTSVVKRFRRMLNGGR